MNKNDYVVFDIETNGLKCKEYDLLSISFYDPSLDKKYTRFFPLELNNEILTTKYNGITIKDLENTTPLTQEEFNDICKEFDLYNKTILTYSGRDFDEVFFKNYLKRKKIKGFENLKFYNIKKLIISSSFSEGNITKDNLCNLFKISGVKKIHSGINDCILEWKLFEQIHDKPLFIIENKVYYFNEEYIIPVTYLDKYNNFKYYLKNILKINIEDEIVFNQTITNRKFLNEYEYLSGQAFEHLINKLLNAEDIADIDFLVENKRKLNYIGKLPSKLDFIKVELMEDSTIKETQLKDKEVVRQINESIQTLKPFLNNLISFIKEQVFNNKTIYSHEIVVNKEYNSLAVCDLSSKDAVLEIKSSKQNLDRIKNQLYYQTNNRDCFLLEIIDHDNFKEWLNNDLDTDIITTDLSFIIHKIKFNIETTESLKNSKRKQVEDKIGNKNISIIDFKTTKQSVKIHCNNCGCDSILHYNTLIKNKYCPKCKK